jgi:hypothetical protein
LPHGEFHRVAEEFTTEVCERPLVVDGGVAAGGEASADGAAGWWR